MGELLTDRYEKMIRSQELGVFKKGNLAAVSLVLMCELLMKLEYILRDC